MKNLQTFALYLKDNHLKDLAVFNLENARKMDIPIMKFFANVPEDLLIEIGIKSISDLLTSIADGTAWEFARENYKKWKDDKLDSDVITKHDIHPSDIILINALRKKGFTHFLPGFTSDINESRSIMLEMDEFFTRSDNESMQVFYEIQKETEARYKEIEEKLKESQQKLQAFFDNAPDGVIVADNDRIIIAWNKAAERIYGYTAEEAIGKSELNILSNEFVHPYSIEKARNELRENGKWEAEVITTTKSGEEIPILVTASILYDDQNMPYGVLTINRDIRERKKIEENLQRFAQELIDSEQQIQTILESAPDAVIVIDGDSIIEHWNTRAEEIFGWKSDLIIGKPLHEYIIPERYRKSHIAGLKRFLNTGEEKVFNTTIEIEAVNQKGQEFPVSLSISPTFVKGKYLFVGFVRDITDRKRSDEKIAKSLQSLNEAQQIAHIGSWEIDLVTRGIIWSDELFRIYGYEPFEYDALGDLFFKHIDPADTDRIIQNVGKAIKNKTSITETYRITTSKGHKHTLIANCNVICNKEGKAVKLTGTVQDITERQEKDDKIAQTLQQLNEAQQMAHIGSWEWDVITNSVTWSEELYRIFGLEPNKFVATYEGYLNYIHPEDRELVNGNITKAMESKEPFNFDHRVLRGDGSIRIINAHGLVFLNEEKQVIKMSGTAQDVTERVLSREELKKAEDTVKAKQQFLSNMSHEIRTPMNAIIGFTKVVLKTELSAKQREYLDAIKISGQTLLVLINDILDLAKVDAGKMKFEKIPFKLSSSVSGNG